MSGKRDTRKIIIDKLTRKRNELEFGEDREAGEKNKEGAREKKINK